MKLSQHFTREEFRCPCCGQCGITWDVVARLEQLRHELGDLPIIVTSGYRCHAHNAEVGGVRNSYHTLGLAADIKVKTKTPDEVAAAAERVGFTGIGIYPSWTHVDIRPAPARWAKK